MKKMKVLSVENCVPVKAMIKLLPGTSIQPDF